MAKSNLSSRMARIVPDRFDGAGRAESRFGASLERAPSIRGHTMPIMQIPRFRTATRIDNLESFIKGRLINKVVWRPDQAVPLLGYMAWPNDPVARSNWHELARTWQDQSDLESVPPASKIIQQHWARIADIFHKHYDLDQGEHQLRRGGSRSYAGTWVMTE